MADEPGTPAPQDTPNPAAPATSDPAASDTAQATSPAPQPNDVPLEVRVRNQQAEITRQQQARANVERERDEYAARIAELEAGVATEDEDPAAPAPRSQPRTNAEAERYRELYEQSEWTRAEAVYGTEVISAYGSAADQLNRAESPVDFVNAFEAYHQARLGGAAPAAAAATGAPLQTRAEALAPRVDSNRSDAPSSSPIDPATFAGGANGGVGGFVRQLLKGPQG